MSGEPKGQTMVEVVITQCLSGDDLGHTCVTRIVRTGDEGMTRDDVLDTFEAALRGAGYVCGMDQLTVQDEEAR